MFKKLLPALLLSAVLFVPGVAWANKASAPAKFKTCLISFPDNAAASAGADATITDTKYLPAKAAQVQETFTTGGAVRIFDYSAVTSNQGGASALPEPCTTQLMNSLVNNESGRKLAPPFLGVRW